MPVAHPTPPWAIPQFSIGVSAIGGPPASNGVLNTIKAYLYQEYADDDDLQAFVEVYNRAAQQYVDWFNATTLPYYPGLSGALLDWVSLGLYGIARPSLSTPGRLIGGFGTAAFGTLAFAEYGHAAPIYASVSDDVLRRIVTWNFYKGDGRYINVRWLKSRVMRFLVGEDGLGDEQPDTRLISVLFGPKVPVRLPDFRRSVPGAVLGQFALGGAAFGAAPEIDQVPQHVFGLRGVKNITRATEVTYRAATWTRLVGPVSYYSIIRGAIFGRFLFGGTAFGAAKLGLRYRNSGNVNGGGVFGWSTFGSLAFGGMVSGVFTRRTTSTTTEVDDLGVGYSSRTATIRIIERERVVTGGAIFGRFAFGAQTFGTVVGTLVTYPRFALAHTFKAAVEQGVLPLPFQTHWTVQVG